MSILAAVIAFHITERAWTGGRSEERQILLTGNHVTLWLGFVAPVGLPIFIVAGWIAALVYEVGKL